MTGGDAIVDLDIGAALEEHRHKQALASVVTLDDFDFERASASASGASRNSGQPGSGNCALAA